MSLKAYVAGRISRQEEVKTILAALRQVGIEITRDWIAMSEQLKHATISNEAEAAVFRKRSYAILNPIYHDEAEQDLKAVLEADIFVILTDEQGSSMYVEMGAAFAGQKLQQKPNYLYAIGPHFDRMVFYQHQQVIRVSAVEEIITDLRKKGLIL
jgi:hypothetical protein